MDELQFTIINDARQVIATVTPAQFADITRQGGGVHGVPTYLHLIQAIRASKDEEEQSALKTMLPAAFVSCRYVGRTAFKGDVYNYVPLVQLDFDVADNEFLATLHDRQIIKNYLTTEKGFCAFDSPRGGLKMIVPITSPMERHNAAYTALNAVFSQTMGLVGDANCKGVVRMMYLSYDPQCQWNDNRAAVDPFRYYEPTTPAPTAATAINWETVDTSSVKGLFTSVVGQLTAKGTVWTKGRHNEFLMGVCGCKWHGVGVAELVKMVHAYINGKYRGDYTKGFVTTELLRIYTNYFGKGLTQSKGVSIGGMVTFKQHLSEHQAMIWTELQAKKTLYIDAPTGSGKTYLIAELAKLAAVKVDLVMPTTALAMQQHNLALGIASATGTASLSDEQRGARVLATCYESIAKASQRGALLLVVDEAHELATAYTYRANAVQLVQRYSTNYEYVVYLSGSMFPILRDENRDRVLRFAPEQPRAVPYSLVTLPIGEKDSDFFRATIQAGALNVFYKNDKAELVALAEVLRGRGLKVALVTADTKAGDAYEGIVNDSTLVGFDVLLTTCLIQAGVNINDAGAVVITFGTSGALMDYIQFSARFRKVVPSIRICHKGELGAIASYKEEKTRKLLQMDANKQNIIKEMNQTKEQGEYSSTRFVAKPDGVLNNGSAFVVDEYALLSERYVCECRNATANVNVLHAYLQRHGFVFVPYTLATFVTDEALSDAKHRGKQVRKENTARALAALWAGTLTPKAKYEKDMQQRFLKLSQYLDRATIHQNPDMLTNASEYKRQYNRIGYALCAEAAGKGFALVPTTAVYFNKLQAVETMFKPSSTVPTDQARASIEKVFGVLGDAGVMETVGTVYEVTRRRVRVGSARVYVYEVGSLRQRAKAAKAIGDNGLEDFLFLD